MAQAYRRNTRPALIVRKQLTASSKDSGSQLRTTTGTAWAGGRISMAIGVAIIAKPNPVTDTTRAANAKRELRIMGVDKSIGTDGELRETALRPSLSRFAGRRSRPPAQLKHDSGNQKQVRDHERFGGSFRPMYAAGIGLQTASRVSFNGLRSLSPLVG